MPNHKIHRICIFSAYFHPHIGGVEQYNLQLATEAVRAGYDVMMVAYNTENAADYEKLNHFGLIRLPSCKLFRERFPLPRMNKKFRNMMNEIRAFSPDCLITSTRFYSLTCIALQLGEKLHKPVYILEHGTGHLSMNNSWLDFLGKQYEHAVTRLVRKKAAGFFGVSLACNRWLEHFNIQALGVVYNSVDTGHVFKNSFHIREVNKIPEDVVLITFAGRLIKEKGVVELLGAFTRLSGVYPNIYLVIAGSGPLLEQSRQKYAASTRILFTGSLSHDDVLDLLKDTDIVAIPSYYPEGLPTLILEAGLCHCALVATARGGTEEVISEDCGFIIEANSEERIYLSLEKLIIDNPGRAGMADKLHSKVMNNFSWEKTTVGFLNTLNSLQIC